MWDYVQNFRLPCLTHRSILLFVLDHPHVIVNSIDVGGQYCEKKIHQDLPLNIRGNED